MASLEFDFHGTSSIYDIELYRYKFDDGTFEPDPVYYQYIDGCANIYPMQGIPAYLNKPHFGGDPLLTSSVIGMTPNKEDHDTYFEYDLVYGALDLQQNLNYLTLGAAAVFRVLGAIFTTT